MVFDVQDSPKRLRKIIKSVALRFSPGLRAVEAVNAMRRLEDARGIIGRGLIADDQEAALLVMNGTNTRMLLATVLAMLSLRAKRFDAGDELVDEKMAMLEPYVEHLAFYDDAGTPEGSRPIDAMAHLIKAIEVIKQVFADLKHDRHVHVGMHSVRPFLSAQDFALFEQRTGIRITVDIIQ
jgi:hypothetical protein